MVGLSNSDEILSFTMRSVPLKEFFEGTGKTRSQPRLNKRMEYYDTKKQNKAAFYVIKLPDCVEAIKVGRATQDIKMRLKGYYNSYGDGSLIYVRTFEKNDSSITNIQPVIEFEKKVLRAIKAAKILTLRGTEYFDVHDLEKIKKFILETSLSQKEIAFEPKKTQPTRNRVKPSKYKH